MDAEQQKGDKHHGDEGTGRTRLPEHGRQQAFTAFDHQRALTVSLMEQVCDPKNLLRAYRRVRSNKGKPGVDGMTVHELADWLRENNAALTASLLEGTYRPQPVRGVQIPKPGGVDPVRRRRDRLIQDKVTMRLHQWSTSWVFQWLWIVWFNR
jgi:RNA-directed DNA polymerase